MDTRGGAAARPASGPHPELAKERLVNDWPGLPFLVVGLLALALALETLARKGLIAGAGPMLPVRAGVLLVILAGLILAGLTQVVPGQARVVQLFGRYVGTMRTPGLRWVNPFTRRRAISTRLRNHETAVEKVNDADGNPIEIAAVVVWQVEDTARAMYDVDDFANFVGIQAETAVRHIATQYPYDSRHGDKPSLRENVAQITSELATEIAARVTPAGVRIVESRLSRLSYAPEIARAMLQRQQADAVVAARQVIVDGAVSMVEMALERLAERHVVELDEERKAAMVSNLLVVLCSERATDPVINTGTLYQ
jgi:regulator of protease activity HflC (stomatin/prohibitin superfamily)